jgi:YVTN family beta-propeller protein
VSRDQALLLTCTLVLLLGIGVSLNRMQERPDIASPADNTELPGATSWRARSLVPVPNINAEAEPQAARIRPYRVAASPDGDKVYVTLAGTEIAPGDELAVLEVDTRRELTRIQVGSQPYGLAVHPSGRWLIVTNRFSNFLSVIDISTDKVAAQIPVEFYSEDLVVSEDGHTAYVSNFFLNQVLVVDLAIENDILTGVQRQLDFDRTDFMPRPGRSNAAAEVDATDSSSSDSFSSDFSSSNASSGVYTTLRLSCGTSTCHMYPTGGFVAGPNLEETFTSAKVHAWPHDPEASPLLRAVTSAAHGGWADSDTGYHHPGGIIFSDPASDPAYNTLHTWIAGGYEGPGISVGNKPRDLLLSPDQQTLYVANTGSLDISVIDLSTLREYRRIATRSPVNDLVWAAEKLVLATLGVGSGHPKEHHPGRESTDRNHPEAEFTLFRDPQSGSPKPLPLAQQQPLGPFDDVDGTAQEKFRDITNDVVLLDPATSSVASYSANEDFTRYTSDSFEGLAGDKKGDVLPGLMQVVGAFPEQIVTIDDRLYITMAGTFQVQEWHVKPEAEPVRRLVPGRVFNTGFKPVGITVAGKDTLVVSNQLDESVTFIDLNSGESTQLSLSKLSEPFPANDFERGEFFVQTSIFSVDQDQSCVHCHYRDTSDGKKWSVSQVMGQNRAGDEVTGGSREVPDLRALVHKVPFFSEGILSLDEPLTMMMEHNPLVDFSGKTPVGDFTGIVASHEEQALYPKSADAIIVATGRAWAGSNARVIDLTKRRDLFFRQQTKRYFNKELNLRDMQRLIGLYQSAEPRMLPNPQDPSDPMVRHGRELFESPQVGCSGCHPAPTFTDKTFVYNQNKSFRPLVSSVPRDNIHTLISADYLDRLNGFLRYWDKEDAGRYEEQEGHFVTPSLHGIWARPPRFLHHGNAISLREVISTPKHPALQRMPFPRFQAKRPGSWERGLNELDGLFDTHGTTSHLSVWDIECLLKYLRSIE